MCAHLFQSHCPLQNIGLDLVYEVSLMLKRNLKYCKAEIV